MNATRRSGSIRALLLLIVLSALALLLSAGLGASGVPASRLFESLIGTSSDDAWLRLILVDVRLPRAFVAFLVGAALGVSGCALQGLFRNPLADPSVLGVSASAALASQLVIFSGLGATLPWVVPVSATCGAAVATLGLVLVVGGLRRGALETLVLGGIALGNVAIALSSLLVSLALRDFTIASRLLQWTLGSLDGRSWMHVLWGIGPVVGGTLWLVTRARELDALLLGDVTAVSLGVDVARVRRDVILATALLTGASVAMGGIVSFVGLVVPHLLRRPFGQLHSALLPAAALAGGSLVVLADVVARRIIAPEELQIGVLTAALGAPWFVALVHRRLREVA
jgi:iron complex transport system permease protein